MPRIMKDYLGHELRTGDHVVTIVNISSGGTYFVTAQIEYMTRSRVYLHNWESSDPDLHKEYTLPEKCILVRK